VIRHSLYVLTIGINVYPKDSNIYNLKFAVADAKGVADEFSTKEVENAHIKVEVKTLVDSAATLSGIRSALEHLIKVCKLEDVVIFYFSGNGFQPTDPLGCSASARLPRDYNFLVFDSFSLGDGISSAMNSLTARDLSLLLLSIQAQRQIVILDSSPPEARKVPHKEVHWITVVISHDPSICSPPRSP
jgi:hypothetical protein